METTTDRKILEAFAAAVKEHEGYYPPSPRFPLGSRAWRNNNPGNVRSSPLQNGIRGGFAYFTTYERGWEALLLELDIKFSGKSRTRITPDSTIGDLFSVYAPKEDNNDPKSYAAHVVRRVNQILKSSFTVNTSLKETSEHGKTKALRILAVVFTAENTDVVTESIKQATGALEGKLPYPVEVRSIKLPDTYIPIIGGTALVGEAYEHRPAKLLDPVYLFNILGNVYSGEPIVWFFPRAPVTTVTLPNPLRNTGIVCVVPYVKTSDIPATTTFILHETMHACYFILNSYGYGLKDDTHSFTSDTDPNPQLNLLRVLEKNHEQLPVLPLGHAPDPKLPVDMRYGMEQNTIREHLFNLKNAAFIRRTLKRDPTERERNALVYGYWSLNEILDPTNYSRWTKFSKPHWMKISNPPRPLGI